MTCAKSNHTILKSKLGNNWDIGIKKWDTATISSKFITKQSVAHGWIIQNQKIGIENCSQNCNYSTKIDCLLMYFVQIHKERDMHLKQGWRDKEFEIGAVLTKQG